MTQRERYKELSNWIRGTHYQPVGDELDMLEVCGMYNRQSNPHGLVRDHIFPRYGGFKYRVYPELLRHPANCRFIPAADNTAKRTSDFAVPAAEIESLFQRIENWQGEWKEHGVCLELIRRYRRGDCYEPEVRRRRPRTVKPKSAVKQSADKRLEFEKLVARRKAPAIVSPSVYTGQREGNRVMADLFNRACAEIHQLQKQKKK